MTEDKARRHPHGVGFNTEHGAVGFDLRGNRWMQFDPRLAWRYEQERAEYADHLKAVWNLYARANRVLAKAHLEGRRGLYRDEMGHHAVDLLPSERREFFDLLGRARRYYERHLA